MPAFTDQTGRTIELPYPPQKIISLVPSQTELLYHLGLGASVAGITKFCIHPDEWFRSKTRVGGTKNIRYDVIAALQPDLIIANNEENSREQVEKLAEEFPVWVSDIATLEDALQMMEQIGNITGRSVAASNLVEELRNNFAALQVPTAPIKAAYLIWKDPFMAAGGDTFINDMLGYAGFKNVFAQLTRYPVISVDDLKASGCEAVLLSSEPYPFAEKHITELKALLPGVRIMLVDGELFSWYGSRLLHSTPYFKSLSSLLAD